MRFGLERMEALLGALGDPQRGRRSIHVVGSNGKSSTTRFCAALLEGEGQSTGAYLSPHLGGWHERVEVNGAPVAPERFASAVMRVAAAAAGLDLEPGDAVTQFEGVTAAAFLVFAEAGCAWQVIEAGLGGRWDATNVLDHPDAVVVTSISLEHTALLGTTHLEIAREKLAVASEGSDRVVVGPLEADAVEAVRTAADELGLDPRWVRAEVEVDPVADSGIGLTTASGAIRVDAPAAAGTFQHDNLATAVLAVEVALGRPLGSAAGRALAEVAMPGRLERIPGSPALIIDGAHNPSGAEALARELPGVLPRPRAAVLALLDDKDAAGVIGPILGECDVLYATASAHPRSRRPDELSELARAMGTEAHAVADPAEAVLTARRRVGPDGGVVICGSLYLLRDLRQAILADVSKGVAMLAPVSADTSPGAPKRPG